MTIQSDGSVGFVAEPTYGTAVTVNRWYEFTKCEFTQKNDYLTGKGIRVSKRLDRLARRTLGKVNAMGHLEMEVPTRGLGLLWNAALGTSTSTLRSGSIYQQVHTPAITDPMPGLTAQTGVPPIGGGTTLAHTFPGVGVDKWEFSCDVGGIAMLSLDMIAQKMLTATAYAAPSYTASTRLFAFPHLTLAIGVNGTDTLTVPTTTVAGSTAHAANNSVTKFKINGDNVLDKGGYTSGSAGARGRRPVLGDGAITGSIEAEFVDVTLRDYYLNQTSLHAVITLTSDQDNIAASGTFAALQFVIPAFALEGDVPQSNSGDLIKQTINFTVLDGESATNPLYVVCVTADTAI